MKLQWKAEFIKILQYAELSEFLKFESKTHTHGQLVALLRMSTALEKRGERRENQG